MEQKVDVVMGTRYISDRNINESIIFCCNDIYKTYIEMKVSIIILEEGRLCPRPW